MTARILGQGPLALLCAATASSASLALSLWPCFYVLIAPCAGVPSAFRGLPRTLFNYSKADYAVAGICPGSFAHQPAGLALSCCRSGQACLCSFLPVQVCRPGLSLRCPARYLTDRWLATLMLASTLHALTSAATSRSGPLCLLR